MIVVPQLKKFEAQSNLSRACDAIFKFFLIVAMYLLSLYWFCSSSSWYNPYHVISIFIYLLYGFVSIYDHFTFLLCKVRNVRKRLTCSFVKFVHVWVVCVFSMNINLISLAEWTIAVASFTRATVRCVRYCHSTVSWDNALWWEIFR